MRALVQLYRRGVPLVEQRWAVALIVTANLLGFIWGTIYWYGGHLAQAPVYLWPFIPDCPLFALLFVPAYLLALRGRGNNAYNLLVAFGLIKYGVWTNLAWYGYWAWGNPFSWMGLFMCLTHIGMVLEGLYLLYYLRPRLAWAFLAGAWFAASDFVDYGLGEYPRIPDLRVLPMLQWYSIVATVLFTAGFAWWALRVRGAARPAATGAPLPGG